MVSKSSLRAEVLEEVQKLLIGPRQGKHEFIEGRITLAYMAGILFPKGEKRSHLVRESIDTMDDQTEGSTGGKHQQEFSGDSDNPLSMANEELPSSVGISFVVKTGSAFSIEAGAAHYITDKNEAGEKGFKRVPCERETVNSSQLATEPVSIFAGAARLSMVERPSSFRADCKIITVSLVNASTAKGSQHSKDNVHNRLYQVALKCCCNDAGIEPYEAFFENSSDPEENILQLQYSNAPAYAVGHGCSVDWGERNPVNNKVRHVEVAYMPRQHVYRPVFDRLEIDAVGKEKQTFDDWQVFDIRRLALAADSKRDEICKELLGFVDFYEKWIISQSGLNCEGYELAADRLIQRMKDCSSRMKAGIEQLRHDLDCWKAFTLANLAMLLQIEQTGRLKNVRSERERNGQSWPIPWEDQADSLNVDLQALPDDFSPRWRPFQLGFFLNSFVGLENPESKEHNIIDLIWFSTGGGKTEAYLLLSCYELVRRRMRYDKPSTGYGTAVITRYTLRFLTADQFARTASLGCALEKTRYLNQDVLGDEPFRVGLFIGKSYKSNAEAKTALQNITTKQGASHKFQVSECPNCGTGLVPDTISRDEDGNLLGFGIRQTSGGKVEYVCPNHACIFSQDLNIPVTVVDEDIYENPPSFLLGTIDKYAMVPWRERAGQLFGKRGRKVAVMPPTLVIQDELHLISGPLGTIASIYESGFDTLIRANQEKLGMPGSGPKYVASSATVRDSAKQLERLTGRPSAIFPPRGVTADDSFFAKEEKKDDTARLYVGVMAQGIRATSAAHWVAAAILQSVRFVAQRHRSKEACDFLWTLLCYCNSKRELGLINGAVNQEVLERMRVYASAQGVGPDDVLPLTKEEVSAEGVTSISETRGNLLRGVADSGYNSVRDFVPCTNMISVGIDIDRLGGMMVNGQPKTTAEYIQATSRVGRSPDKQGPGLVITLYSPAKPRDRSHYEQFKSYHETLYRLVEPTSVTPGSEQALDRACHAAIVTVIRHGVDGMSGNGAAANFDPDDKETKAIISRCKERLLATYPESEHFERERIKESIDTFTSDWLSWALPNLIYEYRSKGANSLLIYPGKKNSSGVGVVTMTSMRGVDVEVEVRK